MIIITTPPEMFSGEIAVPGDKSITHRALMLGAISRGVTEVRGFLDAEDIHSTVQCLRTLGVRINVRGNRLLITGQGLKLKTPLKDLDAGNSGTTARLLLGILAGQPFRSTLTGDQSLKKRPMQRIVEPLQMMGALFENDADKLPLTISGGELTPIKYNTPRPSAQIKSAVLLAGLYARGETILEEPCRSRNHTELMLEQFGAEIKAEGCRVVLQGQPILRGKQLKVPGDISAAAFIMVAAVIIPGSEVLISNVGVNPLRTGIIDVLKEMG
ncbi:MAG: 3-phosphoshikimate 1-carboxyvinyltransferase, partial [Bacillota bacterium]